MLNKGVYKISNKKLKKRRRDYHKKSFINPFYFKIDKNSIKKKFNTLLIIIIFLALFFFIGYTNFFKINKIDVVGGEYVVNNLVKEISHKQLNKRRFLIFKQDKLIFYNTIRLKRLILEQVLLEELKIKKIWHNKIQINIKERKSNSYFINQGQIFILDAFGRIISVIDKIPENIFMPILYSDERNYIIGEIVTNSDNLDLVRQIYIKWAPLGLDHDIKHVKLGENNDSELILTTDKGWVVYLSKNYNIDLQLENYKNLYNKKLKDEIDINYVDLRVDGWVYYK